ncbi:MAG: PHP domain-containing protein [Victivallales bacterium]|nr:PHP domain-containing protein [Victivallales bacterium]
MKIDLHVHSKEVSPCGHIPIEELIPLYSKTQFDAIVLTNHFSANVAKIQREAGHPNFAEYYMESYQKAKTIGEQCGLLVLCGFELRFAANSNDYLVYGLPEDMVADCEKYFTMTPEEFYPISQERGFLFYQAHPFRDAMVVVRPDCLFGIEVKNGHPRHDSRNDIAAAWAQKSNLHKIAGSDCHRLPDVGLAGIETDADVRTIEDLVEVLRNDRYSIL